MNDANAEQATTVAPEVARLARNGWIAYLLNMLLVPGLGFVALVWLYWSAPEHNAEFALRHLRSALYASLAAVLGLLLLPALLWLALDERQGAMVGLILWGVSWHGALVLWGVLNLSLSVSDKAPKWG